MTVRLIDEPKIAFDIDRPISLDWNSDAESEREQRASHYAALRKEQNERIKALMAVKLIDVEARPMPRSKVGKFTTLDDVQSAIKMLETMPTGKAIQVDLDPDDYQRLKTDGTKDPARSIVNVLRRKFVSGGLPFKTYASSDKTIVITKEAKKPQGKK